MGIIYRYYRFFCPSCKNKYASRVSPVMLGTGRRVCTVCGLAFNDKSKEWPELTGSQKFQYFLPTTVLGCVVAALLIAVIALYISRDDLPAGFAVAGIIMLMVVGPWVPYFVLQCGRIFKSKQRFQQRVLLPNV